MVIYSNEKQSKFKIVITGQWGPLTFSRALWYLPSPLISSGSGVNLTPLHFPLGGTAIYFDKDWMSRIVCPHGVNILSEAYSQQHILTKWRPRETSWALHHLASLAWHGRSKLWQGPDLPPKTRQKHVIPFCKFTDRNNLPFCGCKKMLSDMWGVGPPPNSLFIWLRYFLFR